MIEEELNWTRPSIGPIGYVSRLAAATVVMLGLGASSCGGGGSSDPPPKRDIENPDPSTYASIRDDASGMKPGNLLDRLIDYYTQASDTTRAAQAQDLKNATPQGIQVTGYITKQSTIPGEKALELRLEGSTLVNATDTPNEGLVGTVDGAVTVNSTTGLNIPNSFFDDVFDLATKVQTYDEITAQIDRNAAVKGYVPLKPAQGKKMHYNIPLGNGTVSVQADRIVYTPTARNIYIVDTSNNPMDQADIARLDQVFTANQGNTITVTGPPTYDINIHLITDGTTPTIAITKYTTEAKAISVQQILPQ